MMKNKFWIYAIYIVIFCSFVQGLAVSGKDMKMQIEYTPNMQESYDYTFTNNDHGTANYQIIVENYRGAELDKYFSVEPNKFDNVKVGDTRKFKVNINLPEKIDNPGNNEVRVWVKGKPNDQSQGISAVPVVGIRFIIKVLFPQKYIEWGISAPNMNTNEKREIKVDIQNLGEPTIQAIYADIDIINLENNELLANLKTNTLNDLKSWEQKSISSTFDSTGLKAGNYLANVTLYWDEQVSAKEQAFKIGTLDVFVRSYTKTFQKDAINRMFITAESGWNTLIEDISADIEIYDLQKGTLLKEFKSFGKKLEPWKTTELEAYFDTTGLALGNYSIKIILRYEGERKIEEGQIQISEKADTQTTDKIPKPKLMNMDFLTSTTFLIIVVAIFIVINIVLIMKRKNPDVNQEVVNSIKEALKTHNYKEVKQMLLKKGWPQNTADEIIKRAKK